MPSYKPPTPSASSEPTTPASNSEDPQTTTKPSVGQFIDMFGNKSNRTSVGAFHLALKSNIDIPPMSNITLEKFKVINGRDDLFVSNGNSGFNPVNGHFKPKADGIFLLSTHIHISKGDADASVYPKVKVEICVNEDCTLM